MKRKSIAAFLVAMLLAASALLSACGTAAPNNQASSGAAQSPQAAASPSAEATVHHLKVLGPVDETADIKFSDREQYPIWQTFVDMLKAKGLDITYETVPADQYNVVIQTRLASASDLPDLVNISVVDNAAILTLAKQGMFLPINKILEKGSGAAKKFLDEQAPFVAKLNTSPDGNMYWITNVEKITYQGKPCSTCMVVMIRKDWLDKLSLAVPTTADEFETVMKAFRDSDANGNGVADEVLALDPANFNNGIAQWFGLGTNLVSVGIEDQKVVSPWYQPGAKAYFAYLNKLVNDGILDSSLFGDTTGERTNQKIAENNVGALFSYAMEAWLEPGVKAGGAQYQPIGPLPAMDGITPCNSIETPYLSWGKWAFTKNCKDEAGAANLLDVLYSMDYEVLGAWGIEGKTFQVKDGENVYMEGIGNAFLKEMAQNHNCPAAYIFGDAVFPRLRFAPMETEINSSPSYKADYQKKIAFYKPTFPNDNSCYMAPPDDSQSQEISSILTDLNTYSQELAAKLALGDKPLSDWDKYMADLKALKLDRLIEIDQALNDRYNGK